MRAHDLIRKARETIGLTQAEAAKRSGLSAHEYSDIEQHPDEIITNVALAKVKNICATLYLDISSLAEAELGASPRFDNDLSSDEILPRNLLIRKYRERRGASESDLADAIGFEKEAIRLAESDANFLETLPIYVLNDWSKYVGLPLDRLLG